VPAIIDTTVWIDFFRNLKTEQTDLLELIVRRGDAALGDVILSELLQGIASDKEFRSLKRHLSHFPIYPMIGRRNAIQSAVNYRKLRDKGFTVRKTVDCWIIAA
jgi:predicted nucleic acid-binding protein